MEFYARYNYFNSNGEPYEVLASASDHEFRSDIDDAIKYETINTDDVEDSIESILYGREFEAEKGTPHYEYVREYLENSI